MQKMEPQFWNDPISDSYLISNDIFLIKIINRYIIHKKICVQGQKFYSHKTLNFNHIHKFWCRNKFMRLSGLNTKAARVRKLSLLILDCDHHEISWWHHHFGAGRTQWCILMTFCLVKIYIFFKIILHDYAEGKWKKTNANHLVSLPVYYFTSDGSWITWFISNWVGNKCCVKLSKFTKWYLQLSTMCPE